MNNIMKLEKPQVVLDAAKSQKGLHIILELLVFVAVFLVCTFVEGILATPVILVMLFTNSDFMHLILSANSISVQEYTQIYAEIMEEIASSDFYSIGLLFVTIGMTLLVMLFCKLLQRRKMNTLGFHKKGWIKEYLIGWVVGFVLFSAAILICVLTGSLTFEGISPTFSIGTFLLFTVGFIIQGMSEEVLCRGYFLVSVGRRYPMLVAVIANSVLFAALHLTNSGISILGFINLILFGVFASVYFIKRNDIWGICAVHSVWNLVQGNVYNIRVSGMELSCSVLSSEIIEGKELIHGGAFGLEGGLAVTVVLAVGTVILLCMKGKESQEPTV